MIDVTEVLTDPDLMTKFTVTRRPEVVTSKGRSSVPAPETIQNVAGVICAASPDDLDRLPEADLSQRHISIVTQFRLRIASRVGAQNYKPDLVTWENGTYQVLSVDPYPHSGPGFVQAIAGSINIQEVAP